MTAARMASMKSLSLFSGIGGLDLAAHAAGIETVAFCEIEAYAVQVLERRWPGVPIIDDVRKIRGCDWPVDVIHGGFPCQDLSVAGKQAGLEGARSGLWFEMLRVISEIRPSFVLAENVRGAVNLALDTVYSNLVGEGYKVYPYVIPASAVGAPHQRERLFVFGVRKDVADAYSKRYLHREYAVKSAETGINAQCNASTGSKSMENTGCELRQGAEFSGADGVETGNRDADKPERSGGTLWPTPRSREGNAGKIGSAGARHNAERGYLDGVVLENEIKLWPTPSANEDACGTPNGEMQKMLGNNPEVRKTSGQLNPGWVEILMGFPIGWTDPDCDEPEPWPGWPALLGDRLWGTHTATGACRSNRFLENADKAMSPVEFVSKGEEGYQYPYEPPRTVTKCADRAKRLKCLGNAVVPQQAYPFFEAMASIYSGQPGNETLRKGME